MSSTGSRKRTARCAGSPRADGSEKGNGEHVLGVAVDITEHKLAELRAVEDRAALRHMTRVSMLGQLSASIAHQLNQPLAAILGNAEAARKMLSRDGVDLAELREICDDIVTEDNRAAEVIRRLGALYKRGDMKMEPLDLNELIRETLDLLRAELLTRNVVPRTDLAPGTVDGGRRARAAAAGLAQSDPQCRRCHERDRCR